MPPNLKQINIKVNNTGNETENMKGLLIFIKNFHGGKQMSKIVFCVHIV